MVDEGKSSEPMIVKRFCPVRLPFLFVYNPRKPQKGHIYLFIFVLSDSTYDVHGGSPYIDFTYTLFHFFTKLTETVTLKPC